MTITIKRNIVRITVRLRTQSFLTSNFCISTRMFMSTLSYPWRLCTHDPENHAGVSVASGSASHAGQVSGDDSDKEG